MKATHTKNIFVSLSLGSTHTSLIAAHYDEGAAAGSDYKIFDNHVSRFQILGASRIPNAHSIKKGVVSSIDDLSSSIFDVVDEVERQAGIEISSTCCVTSNLGATFDNYTEICVPKNNEIQTNDLERIMLSARSHKAQTGFEYIHHIPGLYVVDGKEGILNPMGMQAAQISLAYHRVCAPASDLHNIQRACRNAGVRINHFVFEPLAAAEGVLTFEEKEFGCVSISVGAFLTHVVVYVGGCPVFSKEYCLGSHHITKDLSIGLRTTQSEAERIKREFGKAIDLRGKDGIEKVDVFAGDVGGVRQVNKKEIYQIIEARVREIFETVYVDLKKSKLLLKTSKGIVLSGGGVLLSGMSLASERTFGLYSRIGQPNQIFGAIEGLKSPMWAASIGSLSPLFRSPLGGFVTPSHESHASFIGGFASKLWHRIREPFVFRS